MNNTNTKRVRCPWCGEPSLSRSTIILYSNYVRRRRMRNPICPSCSRYVHPITAHSQKRGVEVFRYGYLFYLLFVLVFSFVFSEYLPGKAKSYTVVTLYLIALVATVFGIAVLGKYRVALKSNDAYGGVIYPDIDFYADVYLNEEIQDNNSLKDRLFNYKILRIEFDSADKVLYNTPVPVIFFDVKTDNTSGRFSGSFVGMDRLRTGFLVPGTTFTIIDDDAHGTRFARGVVKNAEKRVMATPKRALRAKNWKNPEYFN